MDLLATQPCVEIKQQIKWTEKVIVETVYELKLYDECITVKQERFPLTSIFDISYRKKPHSQDMGFLYLHTANGVRTFYIKEEPTSLLNAYKQLKLDRPELR
ncbi:hypothetical protein [Halalkalibacter hemicellulosilyticus]|uniref:Bacterial Pleckstrin homology domain-containing protein n=1 Tax=Halalkalibacter hemicellulosilyticusJCM 9152 TaxID=1236971 RepID=W4QEW3_9BACI|nr:hypothetical protein [Halalkalibacter hemicellulosilyticus]GAE30447.1 hypothetical protein JCM9152_1855 [Halalkalibacter hemicellulosilyticusJCM 9152]